MRAALAANRAQFYLDVASGPFYGFNRPEREGLPGGDPELVAPGHDGQREGPLRGHQSLLRDRSDRRLEGDHRPDARTQGDDDQVVPIDDASRLSVKLLKNGTLKVYPGYPHGMLTTHADVINPDLLAFIRA